jgi:hypothetical protein
MMLLVKCCLPIMPLGTASRKEKEKKRLRLSASKGKYYTGLPRRYSKYAPARSISQVRGQQAMITLMAVMMSRFCRL